MINSIPNQSDSKKSQAANVWQVIDRLLAGEGDSPTLVLSRSQVRLNLQQLAEALPRTQIHYAVKSNNHPAILSEVARSGSNFDVCSLGEIDDALKTGVKPQSLIHSHPIKSSEELDGAVSKGVEIFVVDNPDEIAKLGRLRTKRLKILIRYRVDVTSKAVVNLQYKYGCTIGEVLPLAKMIGDSGHQFYGLTFHAGSQCVHSENYVKAIHAARELIHLLDLAQLDSQLLDIGGGFPVQYRDKVPTIEEICRPIRKALSDQIRPGIKIVCEPGRFISAGAVWLVCSVIGRASRDGKQWYYLDDGLYSTFSGMVYDQCRYEVIHGDNSKNQSEEFSSVLAGPTCDSFDVMYKDIMLPKLNMGQRLIFPMTGAYCAVSGSQFNSLRRPRYTVID